MPAPPECLSLPFGIIGMFGRFGSLGRFGRFGRIMLLPEFARGTIGPEGVCEVYEGRGVEEKCFFAKRTHCKTSDIQLSNCIIRRYEICRRSEQWLRFGFVWVCLAKKATGKPTEAINRGGAGGAGWGREMEHRPTGLYSLQGRQECLPYLQARMPVATHFGIIGKIEPEDVYEA